MLGEIGRGEIGVEEIAHRLAGLARRRRGRRHPASVDLSQHLDGIGSGFIDREPTTIIMLEIVRGEPERALRARVPAWAVAAIGV
jgi:hypothetical protein